MVCLIVHYSFRGSKKRVFILYERLYMLLPGALDSLQPSVNHGITNDRKCLVFLNHKEERGQGNDEFTVAFITISTSIIHGDKRMYNRKKKKNQCHKK